MKRNLRKWRQDYSKRDFKSKKRNEMKTRDHWETSNSKIAIHKTDFNLFKDWGNEVSAGNKLKNWKVDVLVIPPKEYVLGEVISNPSKASSVYSQTPMVTWTLTKS